MVLDLPKDQFEILLDRIDEMQKPAPIDPTGFHHDSIIIPKTDLPEPLRKIYTNRLQDPKAVRLKVEATEALQAGDEDALKSKRLEYYNLTGFWF